MEIFAVIILTLSVVLIVFSFYDLYVNKYILKSKKALYYFLIFAMPVVGSVIYFYTKRKFYK
jgi:hypothetical protein